MCAFICASIHPKEKIGWIWIERVEGQNLTYMFTNGGFSFGTRMWQFKHGLKVSTKKKCSKLLILGSRDSEAENCGEEKCGALGLGQRTCLGF